MKRRLLRSWIDANLVKAGICLFVAGLASTAGTAMLNTIPLVGEVHELSFALVLMIANLAKPLMLVGALIVGGGVLLRNWHVTLVGFENTPVANLLVDGPHADNTVWIGKRFKSAFDAEAAATALATRLATTKN